MKKIIPLILATAMLLTACGKKPSSSSSGTDQTTAPGVTDSANTTTTTENSQSQDSVGTDSSIDSNLIPQDAETDETKLGEAITYSVKDDTLYLKIKTSAEFDAKKTMIAIVNPGIYLTRDSEFITQCLFDERCFDESCDKEWFDGVYTFALDSRISSIAADNPGTWTMMLYDSESKFVIGEWLYVAEGDGKYHFAYNDSWLKGAGEDKKAEEYDSLEDEVASWFRFNEYNDEWAEFYFDGYYLEETDPQGYDKYEMMVCPEGDYTTYSEAKEAYVGDYAGIGSKCPYCFSIYHQSIEPGKYTLVLAKMGGDVEVQISAEKLSDTKWKLDFENAKCPALESKYADQNS